MNILRIVRWALACLIVFTSIAFIFGVGIASAETGSIHQIAETTTEMFVDLSAGPAYSGFEQFYFANTTYNTVWEVIVTSRGGGYPIAFVNDFESTTFTITSGGSGSGVAWYDKNLTKLYWSFDNAHITNSPVTVAYAHNIFVNTTIPTTQASVTVDSTIPFKWKATGLTATTGFVNYTTTVRRDFTDTYNVTYLSNDVVHIEINKNSEIATKYIFHSYTTEYSKETTFNLNDLSINFFYADGLYFNVTLSDGLWEDYLINATGLPGGAVPDTLPTADPTTGIGIQFNATSYLIGGTANISWIRTSSTPFGYTDDIYLTQPGNIKKILVSSPASFGYVKTNNFPIAGEYNVSFERSILGLFIEVLASDTATVSAEQASYILVNETVPVGVYTSGTYLAGWTGVGRVVIYQDTTEGTKEIDSLPISGTCCIEQTVSQLFFPEPGNYRVVLMKGYDAVRATSSVTAYLQDIIPGMNITVSNISLNKNQYTYGEPYTITYQVDSYNYSNKAKRIIAYEEATGANTLIDQVPAQTGAITRTFDSEMYPFSGALQLRLMGLNATGDYLLAYVKFNLTKIDTEGYGLDVEKSPICSGETGYYTYYSPDSVNIRIENKDVNVYSRNFTAAVSGKTVPFTISRPGDYEIFLRSANSTDVKFTKVIQVKACEANASTTPMTQAEAQNDMALLLTSSFIWALIVTVGLMIAVGIEMKQQKSDALIPMVAVGFLSLAAFTWLTWIPVVVFWSIVLLLAVIFAWQQAKRLNTAGE